jgi:adenine-specific DNA-methyltransferase
MPSTVRSGVPLMTFKRRVLSVLGKDELLGIGRKLELEVATRMSVDELRDVIARSKRAGIEKIVNDGLSRDVLKAICEACGLNASGKEKQPLVQRIVTAAGGNGNGSGNGEYVIEPEAAQGGVARDGGPTFALTSPVASSKQTTTRSAPRRAGAGSSGSSDSNDEMVAYQHADKRKNNPPAGLVEFDKPPPQPTKTYKYDPHLDPQLTWAGKAEHTSFDIDTVSLHIHERVSPEAILRAAKREDVQGDLFARFELPESKAIDFYQHDVGWANRLILGDSLLIMNSLLEREQMARKVQMIYFDPPYGVRFNSNFQASISKRDVKDGDDASLTREPEQIQAYRDTWSLGIHSYLTYMRDRLLLARELLAETGSIFVQISEDNVHHVRELLDETFGSDEYVATIVFRKTGGQTDKLLPNTVDYILWYARQRSTIKYRQLFAPKALGDVSEDITTWFHETFDGVSRKLTSDERANPAIRPPGRFFQAAPLTSQGFRTNTTVPFEFQGTTFHPGANANWKTTLDGMRRLAASNRIVRLGNTLRYKLYTDDFPATPIGNVWDDTQRGGFSDQKIYVVQTPAKAIQRCMLMVTDPGDLVLDPTCGSGTTAFVAEQWGRRWVTCDTSRVALALARQRLLTAKFPFYRLRSTLVRDGFEYKAVPHITLKSIAQNARLDGCKTQAERERVIRESADQEVLYDQPTIDADRIRVAGPFTVEAIPVATFDSDDSSSESLPATPSEQPASDYLGMMIDLLKKSGVQFANNRHLPLVSLRPVRGPYEYLHAEAEISNGTMRRVAISFGPRHAPVTPTQVLAGINETRGYDIVLFVGFACDPEARRIIDTPVHGRELQFANAAPDILVGDLLKTKRTTRLFTTFGAPDVKIESVEDNHIRLTLAGVDLYDPSSGETHHRSGEEVAAWFIDHDYDGRTFCVCQALFPGSAKNPWERLQRALKGTIDEEKFEALCTATSLPFKPGKKVAVKVIDDRGNEVIKLVEPRPSRRKASA